MINPFLASVRSAIWEFNTVQCSPVFIVLSDADYLKLENEICRDSYHNCLTEKQKMMINGPSGSTEIINEKNYHLKIDRPLFIEKAVDEAWERNKY